MSIVMNADNESLTRTTNLPTITTWTMMGWFNFASGPPNGSFEDPMSFGHPTNQDVYVLELKGTGDVFTLFSGTDQDGTATWSTDTWIHLAITVSGTGAGQFLSYVDGVLDITHTGDAGNTADKMWYCDNQFDNQIDGSVAAIKVWDAALTVDEIVNELEFYLPIRWADLNCWTPTTRNTVDSADYSGAGNDWTENGTLSEGDGPPISWGPSYAMVMESIAAVGANPKGPLGHPLHGPFAGPVAA